MELSYLIQTLLKRKWIILISAVLAVLLSALFVFLKGQVYESAAQYSTGFTIQQVTLVNEAFNPYEAETKFDNVIEAFNSQKVIWSLAYDLFLHDVENPDYAFTVLTDGQKHSRKFNSISVARAKAILQQKLDSSTLLTTFNPDELAVMQMLEVYGYDYYDIEKQLSVDRIPRTDYLNIIYQSRNPYLSAYVVNRIGGIFFDFYTSLSSTLNSESVSKIATIVDQKKRQVDSITEKLRNEVNSSGGFDPNELNQTSAQTVGQLQAKLADEKASYNKAFFQLQGVTNQLANLSTPAAPSTHPGVSPEQNNADIVHIKAQLRSLAPNKEDPKVATQIKNLQDELRIKESAVITQPDNQTSELQRMNLLSQKSDLEEQVKASSQTINYLTSQIAKYSITDAGSSMKINALRNEIDIATKEYSDLKSKYAQAEGFKETSGINFRQTLIGQPAVVPLPRHLLLISLIGGVSMFFVSSLVIILFELLDGSVKNASGFLSQVGLPLLAPVVKANLRKQHVKDVMDSGQAGRESILLQGIRKLRFMVERSGKGSILVTSTRKSSGKSTIIEALAYSLSLANKRVLIIDTNFSNNSLTRRFGLAGVLEEFSLRDTEGADMRLFRNLVQPTDIKGVDIVGCKGGNYSPEEILGSGNLLLHLPTLRQHYDFILLEGAAMNDRSDAKELSRYVDGIIAVFAADSTVMQIDKENIHFLGEFGDKFLGGVLNKVQKENLEF
jgi:Mrp family chromosome partitioning ATPase